MMDPVADRHDPSTRGVVEVGQVEDERLTAAAIDRLLPERLHRLRRLTGLPVAFGGVTRTAKTGRALVITRAAGTSGTGLQGLAVPSGSGLGGRVLSLAAAQRVQNYASTTTITHDYDRIVLDEERLTTVVAVPITIGGVVRGVLYAAARDKEVIGDRGMEMAAVVASQLASDVTSELRPVQPTPVDPLRSAADDLAQIIAETVDPDLRVRLQAIHRDVSGSMRAATGSEVVLASREVDVLRIAELGASNLEIAARLGLSPETVKAYLRTAMRKLEVRNRTAAVHAARHVGVL